MWFTKLADRSNKSGLETLIGSAFIKVFALLTLSLALAQSVFADDPSATSSSLSEDQIEKFLSEVEAHVSRFEVSESDFDKLQQVISLEPKNSFARFLLSKCYERSGLADLAEEEFKLSQKLEVSPEQVLRRIRHHIESGELSQAFTMVYYTSKKAPEDPVIILMNGMFYQANGSLENAEAIYQVLLKRSDCPLGTSTALAAIRLEQKKFEEAAALADKDLKMNPYYVSAVIAKAEALLAQNKAKQTIELVKATLAKHPFNRRLNLLLYRAYKFEGNNENALVHALLNLAASDYISFFEDAKERVKELFQCLGRKRSARIVREQTQMIDRTYFGMKFHFYLSQIYFQLRWKEEALAEIESALSLNPEFQPNWYQRGLVKEVLYYDPKAALADYKQARSMERSDQKALRAYQRAKARSAHESKNLPLQLKRLLFSSNK